jgi:hypothetical protein
LTAGAAWAQATPEAAPPPPPPPPEAPPPAAEPPPPLPPPATLPAPPPTQTEVMPATKPDVLPPISVGAWTRVGAKVQGASDASKLNDFQMDTVYAELHAGGKIHKKVGVTLNLAANMLGWDATTVPTQASLVLLEDAIISFDFQDEFHLWAGHLLVPVDRANASGPFFMIPWNYPGFAVGALPKEGPLGRNNGAVVWGDINGGQLTYLAGVFDNGAVGTSPLYSGRLRLALFDKEPGFWGNGSYFGDKDLLSIGVGGQYQKHGSATTLGGDKDYAEVNADVLFEKKLGGGSFFTAEGAYYHYNVLDGAPSDSLYALVAYASPVVGVGNIQPSVRYQWAKIKANTGDNPWNVDVGVAYLIKGPALRVLANFSHSDMGVATANALQFGAQAIFF